MLDSDVDDEVIALNIGIETVMSLKIFMIHFWNKQDQIFESLSRSYASALPKMEEVFVQS